MKKILNILHRIVKSITVLGIIFSSGIGVIKLIVLVAQYADSTFIFRFWSIIMIITWLYLIGRIYIWLSITKSGDKKEE